MKMNNHSLPHKCCSDLRKKVILELMRSKSATDFQSDLSTFGISTKE